MSKLNEDILESWIQLTTAINNDRMVSAMPLNETLICRFLLANKDQEVTATDLCRFTKMQKSQMNRTLSSMEEKHVISRVRSLEDKRQVFVMLNEEHMDVYHHQHERILRIVDTLIERVGKEKATQALEIFNLIAHIAREENL